MRKACLTFLYLFFPKLLVRQVWLLVAGFYYVAERDNLRMIWRTPECAFSDPAFVPFCGDGPPRTRLV